VAQANPSLLAVYLELGGAYLALGRMGQKFQFDNALTAFANVLKVTGTGSEPWWLAKYLTLRALYQRGAESDARTARTILENLEKNYPEYDGDKFRIRSRILELKGKLPGTRA
jgi:hypothetical protein